MICLKNKIKLNLIIFLLDCLLLYTLEKEYEKLSLNDLLFIYIILLSHLTLFIVLYNSNYRIVDFLHVIMFVSILYGIFLDNLKLKCIVLFLVVLIQILWVFENDCIMNTKPHGFGYGKLLSIVIILYSVILSVSIGYDYFNTLQLSKMEL